MMNLIQLNIIKEFETKLGCLTYLKEKTFSAVKFQTKI